MEGEKGTGFGRLYFREQREAHSFIHSSLYPLGKSLRSPMEGQALCFSAGGVSEEDGHGTSILEGGGRSRRLCVFKGKPGENPNLDLHR